MKLNQEQLVMQHLHAVGNLSGLEAADLYRIRDLPKRISTIRANRRKYLNPGEMIGGEMRKDRIGGRYMRYYLHVPQ